MPADKNKNIPPFTTTDAAKYIPSFVDFASASKEGYKVRGEKNWQSWAQDFVDWGDQQEDAANERYPY